MDPQQQQLAIAEQMLEVLKKQEQTLKALQETMNSQAGVHREAAAAAEEHSDAMFELNEQQGSFNGAVEEGTKKNESFTESIQGWLNKGNSKIMGGLSTAVGQLSENFSTLADVITNPLQASLGFLTTFFDAIMERVQDMFKFRNALESVRKEFGSFTENTSNRVKSTYDGFSSGLKEAAGGASVFASKFAMGVDGSIERLEVIRELAGAMGATFDVLGDEFNDASVNLYVMRDALLFNEQALKNVSVMSILSNKSLKQFSDETLASVNKIGRGLGISSKVLGKDVGAFLSNFKSLGRMTGDYVTEITKAAAFTRKLGIEINELIGLNQKFDDFETGAESAAQLAAAFGMVVDPIKLIQAQNPAEVLSDLQKAFAASGKSFETLSRQDKALLSSTSGLSEEQAALAFSAKGLSMSYDEVKTAADGALKGQKSQEEVVRDLADSIENVITPFKTFVSFLDTFIQGFTDAFARSAPVQAVVSKLADALMDVYQAGFRTFGAFLKIGGVTEVFKGLLGVVTMIGGIFTNLALQVEKFAITMSTDPKRAAKELMTGVTDTIVGGFNDLFAPGEDGQKSMFASITDGLSQTFLSIAAAIPGLILGLVRSLKTVLSNLTKTMRSAFTKPEGGQKSIGQGLLEGIKEGMTELISELPSLMPILIEFGTELVTFLGRAIQEFPFATLFVAGGPILTAAAGIFNQLKDTVIGLFSGGGGADALAGAAASVDKGASAQEDLAASLNRQGAAMTGTGPNSFGSLVGTFGGAATKAAEYAAIAFGITAIGGSIMKLIRAVLEPPEGEGKSLIDLFVEAGTKLGAVNSTGLQNAFLIVGAVLVAALGGVAAILMAIATMDTGDLFKKIAEGGLVTAAVLFGIGKIFDEVIPKVTAMISSMTNYLASPDFSKQIENIKLLAGAVKPEDIDAMDNLGRIFSSIGQMMGSLIGAATKLDSFPGVPTKLYSQTDPNGVTTDVMGEESPAGKINRIMGYISSMIGKKSDMSGIVGVITRFEESMGPDLASTTQKFQAIAMILDPMSKMMTAFGSAGIEFIKTTSELAAKGSIKNSDDAVAQVRKFIGAVGMGASDILLDINTRINLSKEQVDALSGKLSLISTVSTFLGQFAKSMGDLSSAVMSFDTSGSVAGALSSMNSFLFGNGGVIDTGAESIAVDETSGVIPMMVRVVNSLAAALNDPVNAISKESLDFFTSIFSPSGGLMGMMTAVTAASKISVVDIILANDFLKSVAGYGDIEDSFAAHLNTALSSFSALDGVSLDVLAKREKNMKGSFNVLGSYISGMADVLPEGVAGRVNGSLTQLNQIRAAMQETSKVLESLDTVSLDAAIDGFGAKMNVVKKKFEINGGAVSITVNMNVTMSAQKMAETLVLDGFVAPNAEFGEYLQSPSQVLDNQYDFATTEYTKGKDSTSLAKQRNVFPP